jgi:hypothetical protein
VLFLDQFSRRKMLVKIYEMVIKRELREGYTEEDESPESDDDHLDTNDSGQELHRKLPK